MSGLVIIGAGVLGREVLLYAVASNKSVAVRGFLDDDVRGAVDGVAVIGPIDPSSLGSRDSYVIAVGDPRVRRSIQARMHGARAVSVVHPSSFVAPTAMIGAGVVIAPYCFIGPGASIGDHAVLNVGAIAGHDASIGAYSILSPQAALGGGVRLDEGVFLGMKAAVLPRLSVGAGARIAAGATVVSDVAASALAAGNPVRSRVMFEPWQ